MIEMYSVLYSDCWSLFPQISERIQTNTERLGYRVALWDDLKTMEQDINQWTTNSIADLTDSVTNLSDKEKTEAHLATFQVRTRWAVCMRECTNNDDGTTFSSYLMKCPTL